MNIKEILDKHKKWLLGEDGSERADLCGANLRGADLRGAKKHRQHHLEHIHDFLSVAVPRKGSIYSLQKSPRLDCGTRNTC